MISQTLQDLFIDGLKDIYDVELRLTEALPRMAGAAESEELSRVLRAHLGVTREHLERFEDVFAFFEMAPRRATCHAVVGLLQEGQEPVLADRSPALSDSALIAAAQKILHYETATYGTLQDWAQQLGYERFSGFLRRALDDEQASSETLRVLARRINAAAAVPCAARGLAAAW